MIKCLEHLQVKNGIIIEVFMEMEIHFASGLKLKMELLKIYKFSIHLATIKGISIAMINQ